MMFKLCALLLVLLNSDSLSKAQDCRTYGQSCSDDYICCGGCCLKGICKDAYMDCRKFSVEDPCLNRYCPDDQVCYTYKPPGCKGCGPLVECRTIPIPKEIKHNKTLTHYHFLNNSSHQLPTLGVSVLCLLVGAVLWVC
ncbi:unnamed protein product [Ceutorhynchus assimilis]|uniref:Uncharacterized protein n=1 Tax=Ceutorhynchus assimilis TaxID=467358 RepID=A0A9N9MMM0_9CUCU|nr:unnamed protein product [Ceutorhynchus assimilis]